VVNPFVDEKTAKIVRFIIEKDGTYLSEIEREIGYSKSTILKRLTKLIDAGYFREEWTRIKSAEAKTWVKKIMVVKGKENEILKLIN
jgi:predicted transcriptional regulator